MSRVGVRVGIVALLAASVAAGCGDSGSSGAGEAASTTQGANQGLTNAQWKEYETSRAALKKANAAATATLKKCSNSSGFQNSAELQTCVGDTFSNLATVTNEAYTTAEGFQGSVSSPCAEALDGLLNALGTFKASAAEMQRTIDSATLAGYPAASQNLELALNAGKSEAQAFEQDCAPS